MYSSLHISRLRGIQNLHVDGLKRVNLIVGKNGTGKSTLLESVALLGGATDARNPAVVGRFRFPGRDVALSVRSLFPGMDASQPVEISAQKVGESTPRRLSVFAISSAMLEMGATPDGAILRTQQAASAPIRGLKLEYSSPTIAPITTRSEIQGLVSRGDVVMRADGFPAAYLGPGSFDSEMYAGMFGELVQAKRESVVIRALRLLEPSVRGAAIVPALDGPVVMVDTGLAALLPLSALGGGGKRLFALAAAMAVSTHGVVAADEIEVGLHHSAYLDLWRVVNEISRQACVQLIATTHSDELLRAGIEHFKGSDDFAVLGLDRSPDGSHRVIHYDREMQESVLDIGLEVRG